MTMLGRYRIEGRLGEGAMADVFRAHDPGIGRTVAIKLLKPEFGRNPELGERFLREARAAGVLRADIRVTPLRQVVLGALNWTVEWFDPNRPDGAGQHSLPAFSGMLAALLLDGILARPEPQTSRK